VRLAIALSLLAAGAICIGAGVAEFAYGEYQQHSMNRVWHSAVTATPTARLELPTGVVARMTFDRLRREVYVLGDEHPGNLKKGPVWLRATSRFGGEGNTVVAGHRDTHFRFLKDARVGDRFTVEDGEGQTLYRIQGIRVVSPEDRSQLAPVSRGVVTLVTCYPFYGVGPANRRMIIRADVVSRVSNVVSTN